MMEICISDLGGQIISELVGVYSANVIKPDACFYIAVPLKICRIEM